MEKVLKNQIKLSDMFLRGEMETDEKIRQKLKEEVVECYKENKVAEELIKQFIIHNNQVENFVIRFSKEENFNDKEKEIAILSAIFHDIAKGYGDFLKHGEVGGEMAEKILLKKGISKELAESVKLAIERHMGVQGYPTEKAKKQYGKKFEFPEYATKVGQIVYECDILTQLTEEGFDKILLLRELDKEDFQEDKKKVEEDKKIIEQIRILSVLKSAKKSYNLIKLESVKKEAEKLWQKIQEKYGMYNEK